MSLVGRVCIKGVWDESIPGITFDENGVSNFCRLQEHFMLQYPRGEKGSNDWLQIVDTIRRSSKGKKYDCIIGVSGGVDSSYLLHISKQFGLKPLAVNLDNGFNSKIAVQNIYKLTSKLNIDLETYVIDYEEIKDLLLSYMKASLPWIDTPTDLAIKATMYKIAVKEGIHFIIRGNDFRSEGKQPKEWTYSDSKQLRYIHKKFGSGIRLRTYPLLTLKKMVIAGLVNKIQDIRPYYYLNYSKQEAKKILISEYDWKDYGGHHYENIFTKFAMAYWLPEKFGIDKRKISLSAQILSGVITREQALELLNEPNDTKEELDSICQYTIKKLGIEKHEFQDIWELENKKTFDYPSNYKLIFGLSDRFGKIISRLYAFTPTSITERKIITLK
jgi:N-acetyl sugar amidotransferase